MKAEQARPAFAEFVIIVSLMMSITALSTDAMLPALPASVPPEVDAVPCTRVVVCPS